MSDIEHKVKWLVSEHFRVDIDTLTPETDFVNDLGADSLDSIELILQVELDYEVEITDNEIDSCHTIKDIVELVNNKV